MFGWLAWKCRSLQLNQASKCSVCSGASSGYQAGRFRLQVEVQVRLRQVFPVDPRMQIRSTAQKLTRNSRAPMYHGSGTVELEICPGASLRSLKDVDAKL